MVFLNTDDLNDGEVFLALTKTLEYEGKTRYVPTYYFDICLVEGGKRVGGCDLRVGHSANTYFGGNIGYNVIEEHRGSGYAGKACKLLFKQAKKHNFDHLYITCNPDNIPSYKTCERVGGRFEGIIDLPEDNEMYKRGEKRKCVFYIDLGKYE